MNGLDALKIVSKEFAHLVGLPAPLFDVNGQALLLLDAHATLIIALDEDDDEAILLIPLAGSESAIDETRALSLLQNAYLGQSFGGAAVGIDPVTQALVLWRRLPIAGLTAQMLVRYVESLYKNAADWRVRL